MRRRRMVPDNIENYSVASTPVSANFPVTSHTLYIYFEKELNCRDEEQDVLAPPPPNKKKK